MKTPLNRLGAVRLAAMLADGDVTAEAVVHSYMDAIHELEPEVRAFAHFDSVQVLEMAREFDGGAARGPLHGLPVAIKDNIDTAGIPSEYGSMIFAGHVPQADAACVAALSAAGAFTLGKTVTAELANFTPGATRNPHNLLHTPGGSSSGSAAAVAAHMAPFAVGTQTAGSVIRPASFCGVTGYVPTRGLVPRAGVKAVSDTLDAVGMFARDVADVAMIAAVLTLQPRLAAAVDEPVAPVIGMTITPWAAQLSRPMLDAVQHAGRHLAQRGARVQDLRWNDAGGPDFAGLAEAQRTVQLFETARALGPEADYRRDRLSLHLAQIIEQGRAIRASDYVAALALGRHCAFAIDRLLGAADVVLAPAAPGEAPRGLGATGDPIFNRAWHLLGCPQIAIPLPHARGEEGLPLAVQLIARPGADARLLSAAAWVEAALARA
ncbi:MAG: amidase [Burkholderiaceae bacterium]